MKVLRVENKRVLLDLSYSELWIFKSALLEAHGFVSEGDFPILLGMEKAEALEIVDYLNGLLRQMRNVEIS